MADMIQKDGSMTITSQMVCSDFEEKNGKNKLFYCLLTCFSIWPAILADAHIILM